MQDVDPAPVGHAHVEERDVWLRGEVEVDGADAAAELARELELRVGLDEVPEARPHYDVVVYF